MRAGFEVAFREGTGKGIALYTSAPDEICAMAELVLLFGKVPNDGRPVRGYADVDSSINRRRWFRAYKGRDLTRLMEIIEEIKTA